MSEPGRPVFSVVLVNYNDRAHLEACLTSLRSGPGPETSEVILVDNASSDGSAAFVAASFPWVRVVELGENGGFGRANNRGFAECRGEFVLFLNTDTVVQPKAFEVLLDALRAEPAAGAAGPALLHPSGRFQVSFGRRVNFGGQLFQKLVANPFERKKLRREAQTREMDWLSAACLCCRREAFEAVGGFDERFFIYFEDIDLCARIRAAGWKLLFVPRARVLHEGGATTAPSREASRLEYRKSQLLFYDKHASAASRRLLRLYLRAAVLVKRTAGGFRGEEGRRRRAAYVELLRRGKGRT
jgi:hypothetical protein